MNSKSFPLPNLYLFQLGQNHPLSQAEIKSLFPDSQIQPVRASFVSLNLPDIHPQSFSRLGGTTKVAKNTGSFSEIESLPEIIAANLKIYHTKNFSLTFLNSNESAVKTAAKVKDLLQVDGLSSRFITASNESLSPLIIVKQHVTEIIVDFETKTLYQTVWVHEFKDWIKRDRFKPYIDPRAGMLPPKLARIMVNLALGNADPKGKTLLDPFCGTGTILMEASLLGLTVTGSDLSQKQLDGAAKNLTWLGQKGDLINADATHISRFTDKKFDLLVTEPFLGPVSFSDQKVPNLVKGLQKLYLGALKNWLAILKPNAKLVLALPEFVVGKRVFTTSDFLDGKRDLGYNLLVKDLVFTRPNARIIRQILVLEKK